MPLFRSQRQNVYHICSRCACRFPLAQMQWQNGKLLCIPNGCIDTAIVGSRDLAVARQVSIDRKELQPDAKLTHPGDPRNDQLDVLY